MKSIRFSRILLCAVIPFSILLLSFGGNAPEQAVFGNSDKAVFEKGNVIADSPERPVRLYIETDGLSVKAIQTDAGGYNISAHYPETESAAINKMIINFMEGVITDFRSACETGTLEVRYQPYRYKDFAVSFLFEIQMIKDGIPEAQKVSKIYDLVGGTELSPHEIFDEDTDYLSFIAEKARLTAQDEAFGDTLLNVSVDDFSIDNKNMYFIQNANGFYDYLDEIPLIEVPLDQLSDVIAIDDYFSAYHEQDSPNDQDSGLCGGMAAYADESQNATVNTEQHGELAEDGIPAPFIAPQDQITDSERKLVALTFDDGPHFRYTPKLLDILGEGGAKATFFLLGHRISYTPELIERMIDEGHSIGNHSYNHKQLGSLSRKDLIFQLDETNRTIKDITSVDVTLLRPPYGETSKTVSLEAKERNMAIIMWNVDPEDWRQKSAESIARHVIDKVKSGDIILLHDIYERSVDAAAIIIEKLTADGFTFVTVDTLLEENIGFTTGAVYRSSLKKVIDYETK